MAGLGFQLERAELVQSCCSARDAFLALPGREKCGLRQSPRACCSPRKSTPGEAGSGTSLAWGLEGLKSSPLGKETASSWLYAATFPPVSLQSWGRWDSCSSLAPAPLGRARGVLPQVASPTLWVESHGSFLWSCLCRGCLLGRGGLG